MLKVKKNKQIYFEYFQLPFVNKTELADFQRFHHKPPFVYILSVYDFLINIIMWAVVL